MKETIGIALQTPFHGSEDRYKIFIVNISLEICRTKSQYRYCCEHNYPISF